MKNYDEFIEFMLYSENKKFNKVDDEYRHQNFFSEDEHYSSIFYSDGYLEIYNGIYPIAGQKRYTIKQVCKLLGHFDKYLAWLCKQYDIGIYKINRIKEIKNSFKLDTKEEKELKVLLKDIAPLLKEEFISVNDIIKTCEICSNKVIKSTSFKKKSKSKSEITITNDEIPNDLHEYFNSRGLQKSEICFPAIIELKSDTYSSKLKAIALKYKDSDFIKYRIYDGFTRYLSYGNFEELYWVKENNNNTLVICEGECFPKGTQVMTKDGWINIENVDNQEVMQYNIDGTSTFEKPIHKVIKDYDGILINRRNRGYFSSTTENHDMVVLENNKLKKIKNNKLPSSCNSSIKIPTTFLFDGKGCSMTHSQLRLYLACSADFTFDKRKGIKNNNTPFYYMRSWFSKERKIERLRLLLKECGVEYKENINTKKGGSQFTFIKPEWMPLKLFPLNWYSELTINQKEVILEEMVFWDGNTVPNRNQVEYSSKEKHNIDVMQYIASSCGYMSTIINRENKFGKWYKLSVLFGKKYVTYTGNKNRENIHYKDKVYCFTMPSGMLVVRQDNKIHICGNCESLCLSYMTDCIDIAGLHNCSAFKTAKDLTKYEKIIILLDLDKYEPSKKVLEKEMIKYNITNYEILPKYNIDKDEAGNKIDINYLFVKNKDLLKKRLDILELI